MEQTKENEKLVELLKNLSNLILMVITEVLFILKIYPEYVF